MPESNYFEPRGIPLSALEEVVLTVDEFEGIRLADIVRIKGDVAAIFFKTATNPLSVKKIPIFWNWSVIFI